MSDERYCLGNRVLHVAAEHGKRRSAQHFITLVENPASTQPLVMMLRPDELELGGFTRVVDTETDSRAA